MRCSKSCRRSTHQSSLVQQACLETSLAVLTVCKARVCDRRLQSDFVCDQSTAYSLLRLPVEWPQAAKSITGILKPLEILTRPQLPRSKPPAGATAAAAAAATAHQAAAASTQNAGSTAGAGEAAAGGSGSQAVQHSVAPAEVCNAH